MSQKKSAARRLSLLAGSSLIAASLTAFGGVALTPSAALAANECTPVGVDPSANLTAPDSYTCAATTYATGITYSSNGSLGVSKTNTTATAVTANGVNLTGNGTDSVDWDSTAGNVTGGAGTAGPVIDVTSVSGAINISTFGVTANQAGTTEAIKAVASGAGAVTVTRSGGIVNNNVVGGQAAIWAQSGGGAVSVTTAGVTNGRLRGILAQTSGTGTVNVTLGNALTAGNVSAAADDNNPATADGLAAIDTIADTGATTITISNAAVNGGAGAAIRSASASTSVINAVNVQNNGGTINGRVDFSGVTAGGVTFNNAGLTSSTGRWTATGASVFGAGSDTVTMGGLGSNSMAASSSINFGAGNDTLNMSALLTATNAAMDFGAGTDAFNMSGTLAVNGVVTLTGLEAFNHSGVTYLGGTSGTASDDAADDVLRTTGGTFTGSGDSRVVMDVSPFIAQAGCATLTGGGDCLDLRGASTVGVTLLTLNDITANDAAMAGFDPVGVTLVDVGGAGTSAAGHFVLDPDSSNYTVDPAAGAMIERPGLFGYALLYDADTQRHNLAGLPRSPVMEYAMLSGAAQSIWHLTAQTVTDRQTELRERPEGGSVWLRAVGEYTKRTSASAFEALGQTFTVDTSHKLYAGTIMGGMDLISGTSGGYDYALGAQIGYVSSSFDLNESDTSGRFSGATGGVYASLWSDGFFLDGTVNLNGLTLDHESAGLGATTNTYVNSVGAAAEAGVRTMLTQNTFAEPLVSLAWVRTSFEEISLSGGEVEPGDAESLRGALGMRLGATLPGESVSATWFVTGRAWNEFEGEAGGVIRNPGADLPFADEFTGAFGEAELGITVFNAANTLSAFATTGVKWKDGYSAVDLALGVRMAW